MLWVAGTRGEGNCQQCRVVRAWNSEGGYIERAALSGTDATHGGRVHHPLRKKMTLIFKSSHQTLDFTALAPLRCLGSASIIHEAYSSLQPSLICPLP